MGKENHTGRKLALGALVAGVAGYVTGLLTAPKSGKETREDIAEKVGDVKDEAAEQLEHTQDELKQLLREAKTKTLALKSKARQDFDEAVVKAKDAQNKAATILKAVKSGEASDPELNRAVKQAKLAKKNLMKFLRG